MINFNNKFYGNCSLAPITDIETMRKIFLTEDMLQRSSMGDLPDRTMSEKRLVAIYQQNIRTYNAHKTALYEMKSEHQELLGLAGFFCETEEDGKYLELCWYIMPQHRNKALAADSGECLLEFAFLKLPDFFSANIAKSKSGLSVDKIIADAFPENYSTKILTKYGFIPRESNKQFTVHHERQYGQTRYELSREIWGQYRLSRILKSERHHLSPRTFSPGKINMERTRRLWFAYFDKGVLLSNGGVESSLISEQQVLEADNIKTFNMYRSDRSESTTLVQNEIKKFLCEENVCQESNLNSITPIFTLGSHEGYTRLLRSLYKPHMNEELLYPESGYGFLAVSAETIKPTGYRLRMIKNIKENGEKIDIDYFRQCARKYFLAKTLFIELKTIAGAIYTEEEIIRIINICKEYNIFLIADVAHINMGLSASGRYPNIVNLCIENKFYEFLVLYTASKTYGLERGRVGFAVFHRDITRVNLPAYARDLYRELGSVNDMPFELAKILIQTDKGIRDEYLKKNGDKHRFNMNVLLAYIQGIESRLIDSDLREIVRTEIPEKYSQGIMGIDILYKPKCGIHMKIDISQIINKFYLNIQIFDAEIFCYVLNCIVSVVTLHGYQLMDSQGVNLRLGFSRLKDIHNGMQAIHELTMNLTDYPTPNQFMPGVIVNKDYIHKPTEVKLEASRKPVDENLFSIYKRNIQSRMTFYKFNDVEMNKMINQAASKIQKTARSAFNFVK